MSLKPITVYNHGKSMPSFFIVMPINTASNNGN